jgi:hypothetical protein
MKCLKRLTLVFICISILLCGCSAQNSANKIVTTSAPEENKGLVEVTDVVKENLGFISADFYGDTLMIFGTIVTNDADFNDNLYIIDAKNNKLVTEHKITEIDCQSVSGAMFDDEGNIIVYDEYNQTAGVYDINCNYLRSQSYEPAQYDDLAKKAGFTSNGLFDHYDNFSRYYRNSEIGNKVSALNYYDETDSLYLVEDKSESIVASDGKKVFATLESDNDSLINFAVFDYENNVMINQTSTETYDDGVYPSFTVGALSDKYAFVSLSIYSSDEDSNVDIPYIWEYTTASVNSAITVNKVNLEQLNALNDGLIADIESNYSIQMDIDKKTEDGYEITYGVAPFDEYYFLVQLKQCLSYFPDGFIDEMHTGFNLKEYETDKLYIDLVNDIEDASAYALNFGNKMVFATTTFNIDTIAHEFMHIIEVRVNDYYYPTDIDFEIEWEKYIPDNFTFNDDDNEFDDKYFVSYYSMTSPAEDKAEIFMNLFQNGKSSTTPYWYDATTPLGKKTNYLCDSIRKAFPSVQNAESVFWENCLNNSEND